MSSERFKITWCSLQLGSYPNQGYGFYSPSAGVKGRILIFLNKSNSTYASQQEIPIIDLSELRSLRYTPPTYQEETVEFELYECNDLEALLELRASHEKQTECDLSWGFNNVKGQKVVKDVYFDLTHLRGEFVTKITPDKICNLYLSSVK